jgi:hypothetical protein
MRRALSSFKRHARAGRGTPFFSDAIQSIAVSGTLSRELFDASFGA